MKSIFDLLGKVKVCRLVFSISELPKTSLLVSQKLVCLQIQFHTFVHITLHGFPYHAGETDGAIAGRFLAILSTFRDGNHDRLSPYLWESAFCPAEVVDIQEGVHCKTAKVGQHLVDVIWSRGLLGLRPFSITTSSDLLLRLSSLLASLCLSVLIGMLLTSL